MLFNCNIANLVFNGPIPGLHVYNFQQNFEIQLFLLRNSKAFKLLKLYVFLYLL